MGGVQSESHLTRKIVDSSQHDERQPPLVLLDGPIHVLGAQEARRRIRLNLDHPLLGIQAMVRDLSMSRP